MQLKMIKEIHTLISQADGVLILAGAGMSVDSGLPDFRGATGMWTEAKEQFISLATASGLDKDPVKVWNFYANRIIKYADVEPHAGYTMLHELLTDMGKSMFVVTTNVDGHFHKAGYDPARIYEMHGSLAHVQCKQPCCREVSVMPSITKSFNNVNELPKCEACGDLLRPNVMMFSDPGFVWKQVDQGLARYQAWCAPMLNVVGIEIGAGTGIPSLRLFGEEHTAALIRINPHEAEVFRSSDVAVCATARDGIAHLLTHQKLRHKKRK